MKFTAPAKSQNGQFPAPAKFGHSRPRPSPTPCRLLKMNDIWISSADHLTEYYKYAGRAAVLGVYLVPGPCAPRRNLIWICIEVVQNTKTRLKVWVWSLVRLYVMQLLDHCCQSNDTVFQNERWSARIDFRGWLFYWRWDFFQEMFILFEKLKRKIDEIWFQAFLNVWYEINTHLVPRYPLYPNSNAQETT